MKFDTSLPLLGNFAAIRNNNPATSSFTFSSVDNARGFTRIVMSAREENPDERREVSAMPKTMPRVVDCDMTDCAYNEKKLCHAMAINVGFGSPCATCHTFMKQTKKAGYTDTTGGVGACKVGDCKFNESLECTSPGGIHIGKHSAHADCKTFAAR